MTLKSLIVGTPQWDYEPQELGDWSLRYGFLDAKPYFFSKDRGNALELSFRVTITRVSSVWLYDDGGRSIHGCEVLLDPDVDPLTFPAYTPSSNRKVWPHHLQHAEGSLQLFNLPNGTHVITLVKPLDADVRLSHVITWH